MCGIVAAVSSRNIVPILIEGLRRLEYRATIAASPAPGRRIAGRVARRGWRSSRPTSRPTTCGGTGIAHPLGDCTARRW